MERLRTQIDAIASENVSGSLMEQPRLILNLCKSYSVKVTLLSKNVVSLSMESQLTRICKFLASRIVPGSTLCGQDAISLIAIWPICWAWPPKNRLMP